MNPYPTYKPSNIEWLGDVPGHWKVPSVKKHYDIQLGKMLQHQPNSPYDIETPYLKALHVQWDGIDTVDPPTMYASPYDVEQFGVKKGDLLVCEGGEGGRCSVLRDDADVLIIQNALHRVRPRQDSSNDFLQYTLSVIAATGWFDALNDKATIAHFTREKFSGLRIPLPPLHEQRAIARYLDYMDRRIQRYIRAKERLIGLLEEQKRAVINQAVTRGLDLDVRLKSSGVEWLRNVPAHWEVRRLKFLATKFGSGVTPRGGAAVYKETGIPLLRSQNVHFDGLRLDGVARIDPELHNELSASHVVVGDVLLNITGASIGRTCAVPERFEDGNVNQHVCIIRPRRDVISSAFLTAFLSTSFIQRRIRNELGGASREGLTLQSIRDFEVSVPPLDEQHRITDYIRERSSESLGMSNRTLKQIELIREYRTRLIADVVTGKLDVREAAAGLPDDDEVGGVDYPGTEV